MPRHQHVLYITAIALLTLGVYFTRGDAQSARTQADLSSVKADAIIGLLARLSSESVAFDARLEIQNATTDMLLATIKRLEERIDALEEWSVPYPPPPPLTEEQLDDLRNGIIPELSPDFYKGTPADPQWDEEESEEEREKRKFTI